MPEGEHWMVARIDWTRSNYLSFGIRAGETTEIEVGSNVQGRVVIAAFYYATIGFQNYLYLRHRVIGSPVTTADAKS